MKNEIIVLNEENIKDMIYEIRSQKVMLDYDLAKIYGYTTKAFNQQVTNNIEKFDEDFMFQLSWDELKYCSRSKKLTLNDNNGRGSNIKYLPYAFTEEGIYMLMTVLKGELATKQSKILIRLFKSMKDYIVNNNNNMINYDNIINLALLDIKENKEDIKIIKKQLKSIDKLLNNKIDNEILILDGCQVESNIAYNKIYGLAKKSIYIIDNYIDLKTLVLLKDINKKIKVTIFSDNINNKLHKIEYEDFINEYNLDISFKVLNNKYHDRYIIIDYGYKNEVIYHCGASSKDSGKRITTITKINDIKVYDILIEEMLNNNEFILK